MKKLTDELEAIAIEDMRKMRGYSLVGIKRTPQNIPEESGIYLWRYLPTFSSETKEEFLNELECWSKKQPIFFEEIGNGRLSVNVKRSPLGMYAYDRVLGLKKSSPKLEAIANAFDQSEEAKLLVKHTLEILFYFSPPLYVGKADCLRQRIMNHLNRDTPLLGEIEGSGLDFSDIYVSFVKDNINFANDGAINLAFEEVLQRITNPPMTKRYG